MSGAIDRQQQGGPAVRFVFAGGGTGGHIYPALAVVEQLRLLSQQASFHFFCSDRAIDARILSAAEVPFTPLPARGLTARPHRMAGVFLSQVRSYRRAKQELFRFRGPQVVVGVGGFASAPAIFAAHRLRIPVAMINVDIVPGKANRFLSRYARRIFVQFEQTRPHFGVPPQRVEVTGCPLRAAFRDPDPAPARQMLGLDSWRRTLLITGASSGAATINKAVSAILPRLDRFEADWQIVHLIGRANYDKMRAAADKRRTAVPYHAVDYYDDMPSLYATADLLVGRAGAVSIAEYAASGTPAICLPYPHHRDQHQRLNAEPLANAGGAVIIDDKPGEPAATADELARVLGELMEDDDRRERMAVASRNLARLEAAETIARRLLMLPASV